MTEPNPGLREKYCEMLQALSEERNKSLKTINDAYAMALAAGGNPADLYREYVFEREIVVAKFSTKGRAVRTEYIQLAGPNALTIESTLSMVPAFPAPKPPAVHVPAPPSTTAPLQPIRASPPASRPRAGRWAMGIIFGGLAALAILANIDFASSQSNKPSTSQVSDTGSGSSYSSSRTVVYEVEGTATTAGITMKTPTGTSQATTAVPLLNKNGAIGVRATMERGDFAHISAQNKGSSGSITCKITVDGVLISKVTSQGGYTIASCDGRVP